MVTKFQLFKLSSRGLTLSVANLINMWLKNAASRLTTSTQITQLIDCGIEVSITQVQDFAPNLSATVMRTLLQVDHTTDERRMLRVIKDALGIHSLARLINIACWSMLSDAIAIRCGEGFWAAR